jgi:cytochrome b6-f complex iron-sulfur subunit
MQRRGFLGWLLGLGGAMLAALVAYPVAKFLKPPEIPEAATRRVMAAELDEVAPGNFKIFPFGGEPGILIRTSDGAYRAFAGTCTHLACTVQYREPQNDIFCACHNGIYDIEGRNVSGPPPRPLPSLIVHETDEGIVVERGETA